MTFLNAKFILNLCYIFCGSFFWIVSASSNAQALKYLIVPTLGSIEDINLGT